MTRSSRDTKGISLDTVEWLGADIGAKAPVPSGFRLADARWRTGLADAGASNFTRFTTGSYAPIEKQN